MNSGAGKTIAITERPLAKPSMLSSGVLTQAAWKLQLDGASPKDSLTITGGSLEVVAERGAVEVQVRTPWTQHTVLSIRDEVQVVTFPGGVHRVYARVSGSLLLLSNQAHLLFGRAETIRLRNFDLLQQLAGSATPVDNLFEEVSLLSPATQYVLRDGQLEPEATTISPVQNPKVSEAEDLIHQSFDEMCRTGAPLAVLLSGGYDSRLNLALALYYASKHGNEIYAVHEFKDRQEHEIAKALADAANVPFVSTTRDRFAGQISELATDVDFIRFNSGLYRDIVLRWSYYLQWIRASTPGCIFLGLGSEAHKGKFYRQIRNMSSDPPRVLGLGADSLREIANAMRLPMPDDGATRRRFAEWETRSSAFSDRCGRIDFIHFHAYASKHSAARSPYLNTVFDIRFPFLANDFLSVVFSLPKECKQDAAFVKQFILKIAPSLARIPVVSGNQKAFEGAIPAMWRRIGSKLSSPDTGRRYSPRLARQRLENTIDDVDSATISPITSRLRDLIQHPSTAPRSLRINDAIRLYLYFRQVEKDLEVRFECGGDSSDV